MVCTLLDGRNRMRTAALGSVAMLALLSTPGLAQDRDHGGHGGHQNPAPAPAPTPRANPHAGHDMGDDVVAIGIYPSSAAGSGTSRLPGVEGAHTGLHIDAGSDWMLMAHGSAWTVGTEQTGPRGDSGVYVQSMAMLSAERDTGWGRIEARTMVSLEPLMDSRGYPNLFASGETSRGEALVDRQHPHDLFMELSARIDVNVGENGERLFLYGGPVGEPALGPSAFMHRRSARYNPEAPISHHWFDATHITYGVVTAGYSAPRFQIEASAFRGAEPDENRWGIETPRLDSWSVRGTWTPNPMWALQISHGRLSQPEALHPNEDEARTTASVHYARGGLSATVAFSNKNRLPGATLTAWLAEASWDLGEHHTIFGRIENVANDELFPDELDPLHEQTFRVSKFQLGYAYRLPLTDMLNLALGGTVSAFAFPRVLEPRYGDNPMGYTLFARLSLGL
jgi:hypothetical protein